MRSKRGEERRELVQSTIRIEKEVISDYEKHTQVFFVFLNNKINTKTNKQA